MKKKFPASLLCAISALLLLFSTITAFGDTPPPTPPPTTPMEHSKVVGCGSYNMHDWRAGCCEGYGGCTNQCIGHTSYCD